MATQVTYPATTSPDATDWQEFIAWLQKVQRGYINIEIDETNKQVEAGSIVEVNGEVLYSSSDENITDNGTAWASISNSTVFYVYAVGGASDEYQYSTTTPSWDNDKGGWYNGNNRAVAKGFKDGSGNLGDAQYYDSQGVLSSKEGQPDRRMKEPLLFGIEKISEDLTLSGGTTTNYKIRCRDLHVTANTTLKTQYLIVEGDLIIDTGVTLTIDSEFVNDEGGAGEAGVSSPFIYMPGDGGRCDYPTQGYGHGCLGGYNGRDVDSTGRGCAGGGSLNNNGGDGSTGGDEGLKYWSLTSIGGKGGDADNYGGGGGAGPGGGGGGGRGDGDVAGKGGPFICLIVFGKWNNQGSIVADGQDGTGYTGGGGGGGLIIALALGDYVNGGSLYARGGDGYVGFGEQACGGGGGHIHFAGFTSSFPTMSVAGGASSEASGATGTTDTVNLSTSPYNFFGGVASDTAGILTKLLMGVFI